MQGAITVWADQELGRISRHLYGNFAEHLGRCVYGGIWVGPRSPVPNDDGLRTDVVEALRRMRLPVLRWPGGCFADDYHWEWGVGPQRRPRRNLWWDQPESNEFGTDEFLRLCRAVGCEPYLAVNVGSGTVEEAVNWMEYCNSAQDSHYANLRRNHGHREPYGVRYWGVGNESYGCGGGMSAEQYAYECRKYACFMRKMGRDVEGGAYLVAGGLDDGAWNPEVLRRLAGARGNLDALSIHLYCGWGQSALDFGPADYYRLLGEVTGMERSVRQAADLLDYYSTPDHRLGLVVDEWGTWWREATVEAGLCQQSTLRDGLYAAAALNMFNRHCTAVDMTNMAQTVNVLQAVILTRGSQMVLTPTYWAYEMLRGHQDATRLGSQASSVTLADDQGREYDALSVSASRAADDKVLTLSVANLSLEQDCRAQVVLRGLEAVGGATARVLTAPDIHDHNDFGEGERVTPMPTQVAATLPSFTHTFPAKSLTVIELSL